MLNQSFLLVGPLARVQVLLDPGQGLGVEAPGRGRQRQAAQFIVIDRVDASWALMARLVTQASRAAPVMLTQQVVAMTLLALGVDFTEADLLAARYADDILHREVYGAAEA